MHDLYRLMTRANISAPARPNANRQCTKCGERKPDGQFYVVTRGDRESLSAACKVCTIARAMERHRRVRGAA